MKIVSSNCPVKIAKNNIIKIHADMGFSPPQNLDSYPPSEIINFANILKDAKIAA